MRVAVAVLFPGQGAQKPGMGLPWRDHRSWRVVERAEAALEEPVGELLLDAPEEAMAKTRNAQLAVLLASLLAWEAVRPAIDTPVAVAGHSLGQLTALVAAGVLGLEEAVRLTARRGDLTEAAADRNGGRMAAVLGASAEDAEAACAGVEDCWLANDNAPGQVVLGGTGEGLEAAGAAARAGGARRVVPLNVQGAFHTPLMADAAAAIPDELARTRFTTPSCRVVSNEDAVPYDDADEWEGRLARHLVRPVRWRQSMVTLAAMGADSFVEVGPGGVLGPMARRTVTVPVDTVATPADLPAGAR
jgi:[acyl-carrier-protein] S-malonyltransferase